MKTYDRRQVLLWRAEIKNRMQISPLPGKSWNECFAEENGELVLYFNDADGSTDRLPESKVK